MTLAIKLSYDFLKNEKFLPEDFLKPASTCLFISRLHIKC